MLLIFSQWYLSFLVFFSFSMSYLQWNRICGDNNVARIIVFVAAHLDGIKKSIDKARFKKNIVAGTSKVKEFKKQLHLRYCKLRKQASSCLALFSSVRFCTVLLLRNAWNTVSYQVKLPRNSQPCGAIKLPLRGCPSLVVHGGRLGGVVSNWAVDDVALSVLRTAN